MTDTTISADRIQIDRLALRLSGLSKAQARELAQALARRLAAAEVPAAPSQRPSLRLRVAAGGDESIESLSERLADALLTEIGRTLP